MNAVTHLEKVIVGEVSAVTHLEKVIAGETSAVTYTEKVITGEAPPITHLQKVIAGVESPVTHLEYIWAGGSPTPTEHEYTGAVPYTFNANGSPLLSWRISGNTVQSTTPTPDNPITPQGCGDLETTGTHSGQYKIPVVCGGTTTPIYLGEVETTRRVKKLVLDGTEIWAINQSGTDKAYFSMLTGLGVKSSTQQICTHFIWNTITSSNTTKGIYMAQSGVVRVRENEPSASDLTSFKSYLQQQYATGTPVTVWYVLATPETGIVNEPLMLIGDYADEVYSAATIPTNNGSTTIDVDTTVKPSEIYIKYKGV